MPDMNLTSDVRGNVWKIEVQPGESVSEGQDLLILECMKTEIPVVAPKAGVVAEIAVAEGDPVDERQLLLVLTV